jgi:hypothetical protein
MPSIHTIDSRNHLMLETLHKHYSWSDKRTFNEIQVLHKTLVQILEAKGIKYEELRAALVPQQQKHEAAFLFDYKRCDTGMYGKQCGERLLQLLERDTTHSILSGDLKDDHDEIARKLLAESAIVATDLNFKHPCNVYAIYVNNLSASAIRKIDAGLKAHQSYIAYVPCTCASLVKTFISLSMGSRFIKHKRTIIVGHEDDRPNCENHNLLLYDFEQFDFTIKSLQGTYYGVFLAYKIERMFLEQSDGDLEIALRAMSKTMVPLVDFTVFIEDQKFDNYLMISSKRGILEKAGLAGLSKTELEEVIRQKLRSNYIYNMEWRDEPAYKLSKFNVMLEFPRHDGYPERLVVALEYRPAMKQLRLITVT